MPSLKGKETNVRGYTVLRTGPGQFVSFELLTPSSQFDRVRPIYQTTTATAKIEPPEIMQASRRVRVDTGLRLLDAVGTQTYKDIIAARPERWERRYKPGPDGGDEGAKEIAYRRVRLQIGPRSLIDPESKTSSMAMGNKSEGFIVQTDVRVLGEGGSTADSRAGYFLSFDKSEETWLITTAYRQGAGGVGGAKSEAQVGTETGARVNTEMVIKTEATGQGAETHKPTMEGEGYISQVETALLPYLLMKAGIEAEHGFYAWRSGENKVMLRKDLPQRIPADNQMAGGWKITTHITESRPPQTTYYDETGDMVRSEMSDGSIWEPTTLVRLKQLWESKGLPTK